MDFSVERWQAGDADAFMTLFNNYKHMVFKTAFLITGSKEEAEDILQEVFIVAWKSRHTFKPEKGKLITWLQRITVNMAVRRYKKQEASFPLEKIQELRKDLLSPEEQVLNNLEYQDMIRAIKTLHVKQRTVIILRFFNELSLNEIAAILGIPLGTVKSRLHQGLKKLHEQFNIMKVDV